MVTATEIMLMILFGVGQLFTETRLMIVHRKDVVVTVGLTTTWILPLKFFQTYRRLLILRYSYLKSNVIVGKEGKVDDNVVVIKKDGHDK